MNAAETRRAGYTLTLRGPRVIYGTGIARAELAAELGRLGVRQVLLVASPRERQARGGLLQPVTSRIAGRVRDVRRHVPIDSAVRQAMAGFFTTISGLKHTILREWRADDMIIQKLDVSYTRHDGETVTIPAVNLLRVGDGLIANYEIYVDLAPVYA